MCGDSHVYIIFVDVLLSSAFIHVDIHQVFMCVCVGEREREREREEEEEEV